MENLILFLILFVIFFIVFLVDYFIKRKKKRFQSMRNQYEKQEKVLWYAQIIIFLGVLATWFNHMDMHTFYTINIILSVISIISLTLDRFYFSEKIGQKVHNSYSVAYGLLVIFTLLLVIQYAGILKIDLIMQEETKMIWALTPALSLLWKTKFIAFREWNQR